MTASCPPSSKENDCSLEASTLTQSSKPPDLLLHLFQIWAKATKVVIQLLFRVRLLVSADSKAYSSPTFAQAHPQGVKIAVHNSYHLQPLTGEPRTSENERKPNRHAQLWLYDPSAGGLPSSNRADRLQ